MNKMVKCSLLLVFLAAMILNTGCGTMSYLNYQSAKTELLQNRVLSSGNADAIGALQKGVSPESALKFIPIARDGKMDGGVMAFSLTDTAAWDVFMQHPVRGTVAAVTDGVTAYYAYDWLSTYLSKGGNASGADAGGNTSGGSTYVTPITGNGNTVNVGNSSTETTTIPAF